MTDDRSDDQLQALLRSGDPAADGNDPTPEEMVALRRLALNRVPDRHPLVRWLPAAAATVAAALAIVWLTPSATRNADVTPGNELAIEELDPPHRQQIQFATENGTRIIWVLDPELTL